MRGYWRTLHCNTCVKINMSYIRLIISYVRLSISYVQHKTQSFFFHLAVIRFRTSVPLDSSLNVWMQHNFLHIWADMQENLNWFFVKRHRFLCLTCSLYLSTCCMYLGISIFIFRSCQHKYQSRISTLIHVSCMLINNFFFHVHKKMNKRCISRIWRYIHF